ncbi:MAG: pilin [Patescibacteria group bacterium]
MNKKYFKYSVLLVFFLLLLPLVVLAQAKLANPLGNIGDVRQIFARIVGALAFFSGILALVYFILGGYRILTAAGNQEKFAKGKTILFYSVVGFVVATSSYFILISIIDILTEGQTTGLVTTPGLVDPLHLDPSNPAAGPSFYGGRILSFLVSSLGAVTLLVFVYAGWLWMTAAGNEEKVAKAKQTIIYGILGLIAVLGSYMILNFIYTPFYTLLKSGESPAVEEAEYPEGTDPSAINGACFDLGMCEETNQAFCNTLGGTFYKGKTCSDYGCCVQTVSPDCGGSEPRQQDRVSTDKCTLTLFGRSPVAPAPPFGCQCDLLQEGNSCYAPVKFIQGMDCGAARSLFPELFPS